MRILVYHGKHDRTYWDASTPEREDQAVMALFLALDRMGCYDELRGREPKGGDEFSDQREWYRDAQRGDVEAARELLRDRLQHEYEYWEIVNTTRLQEDGGLADREIARNFARRDVLERAVRSMKVLLQDKRCVLTSERRRSLERRVAEAKEALQ